jgi:hypothetical protein
VSRGGFVRLLAVETGTSWPRWSIIDLERAISSSLCIASGGPRNDVVVLELGASAVVHGTGLDRQRLTYTAIGLTNLKSHWWTVLF